MLDPTSRTVARTPPRAESRSVCAWAPDTPLVSSCVEYSRSEGRQALDARV